MKKCGSNKIKILREIKDDELNRLLGKQNGNTNLFNMGAYNTGCYNSGNYNSGYYNSGIQNTGNWNSGYYNTGNWNSGVWNSGNWNTGSANAGNANEGNANAGNQNTGDHNTGSWNTCDFSTGLFNTKERTVTIFNKDSGLTFEECQCTRWYSALYSSPFILTKWIKYTEEEKKESIIRQSIGGYLKEYTFEEACANWWNNMSEVNKNLVQTMPNFDKEIFKEITGIEIE